MLDAESCHFICRLPLFMLPIIYVALSRQTRNYGQMKTNCLGPVPCPISPNGSDRGEILKINLISQFEQRIDFNIYKIMS